MCGLNGKKEKLVAPSGDRVNPRRACLCSLKAVASLHGVTRVAGDAVVFSYCQVYKYRRFRTVRQNTSGKGVINTVDAGNGGWGGVEDVMM